MNLLEQIAKHLEFCGFGNVPSDTVQGNIHWGNMPDQPDRCICVFSSDSGYGGSEGGARIQVYVRAKTTREAYELSQAITEELAEFEGFLGGDGAHACFDVINSAAGLGADTKKRELYSSNYLVHYCDY